MFSDSVTRFVSSRESWETSEVQNIWIWKCDNNKKLRRSNSDWSDCIYQKVGGRNDRQVALPDNNNTGIVESR